MVTWIQLFHINALMFLVAKDIIMHLSITTTDHTSQLHGWGENTFQQSQASIQNINTSRKKIDLHFTI